ncbi:MAG: YdcF family protein, partial [Anaerolineaceae bacterium]
MKAGREASGCLKRGLLTAGGFLMLAALAALALRAAGAFLIVADPLQPVDAVAVLSGGSPERIQTAAGYFRSQEAEIFIITDTGERIPTVPQSVAQMAVSAAEDEGVPGGKIVVTEEDADSTADEADAVREALLQRNKDSVLVVTDPYHTRRTRMIFRREFRGSGFEVIVRPVSGSDYRSDRWWTSAEGWRQTLQE